MDRRRFIGMSLSAAGASLAAANAARAAEMILKDCEALDTLAYFSRNAAGELILRPEVADKIIDFHAHIGLSFLGVAPLDLDREDAEAKPYFPVRGNPIKMDGYAAESFTEETERTAQVESVKQAFTKKGYAGTHTPKNLLKEMDRNRVTHSVLLAIDYPGISRNSETYLKVCRQHPRLIPFVSVHPKDAMLEHKVKKFREAGAVGMKVHPPMQFIRANHPKCMKLTKLCGELGMPVLFHSGSSPIAPDFQKGYPDIEHFEEPVAKQPGTTFILGHGGIGQWRELISLAKRNPNVYIEISGQPPAHIREMLDAGLEDRVLFGSDWPYYLESLPLAKLLLATDDLPAVRQKILYDNAVGLLRQAGAKI